MGRLDEKVALITGGSSGLGEAMGKLFATEGARVVLTDVNEERGKAVADKIQKEGAEARFFLHDVTKEEQWEKVVQQTLEEFGRLDVVVNNAGIGSLGNVEETTFEDWQKVISVNLDAVF